MARDQTFSDLDLIRIFSKHLTPQEQTNIICFFKFYVRGVESINQQGVIPPNAVRQIVGLLLRRFPLGVVLDRLIDLFEDAQGRIELEACERANREIFRRHRDILPDVNALIVDLVLGQTSGR
jgi:hypothetical protein